MPRLGSALLLLLPLLADRALADEQPASMDDRIRRLEQRLDELQKQLTERPPSPPPPVAAPAPAPIANVSEGATKAATKASLTIGGYVEAFYQWSFNQPSNHVTNYRGFDDRSATFSLENAVLDAQGSLGPVSAHVAVQFGLTPETYYASEPVQAATAGAGASGPSVWKFLQQANLAYTIPVGRGLTVDAGLFLSPIGPEGMAIKDQWNWSRSDLFFGLPFYHTGARATYPLSSTWTASLQVYDGWNSVVDGNGEPSVAVQLTYNVPDRVTWNLLYFGGVERSGGAPEGQPWRNLFDSYVAVYPKRWLGALAHVDGGFEENGFGTSAWAAGALYLRFHPVEEVYLAARGDLFYEWIPDGAAPIFWAGAHWITSGTATVDVRPADNLSVRLEYRHDQAERALFFAGSVAVDAMGVAQPNARSQDTITVGATAWF